MSTAINSIILWIIPLLITIFSLSLPAYAKYRGGTGEPNDPYLIYTAEHLNEMSAEPNDWDKHFKLMADIDLSGYSYDRAVIAPDVNDVEDWHQGTAFTGVFDGNVHKISHLTIVGEGFLGLFGHTDGATISDLGLEAVDVNGTGAYVGSLVGGNYNISIPEGGILSNCYSSGTINGNESVGGLVGSNGCDVSQSWSTGIVSGRNYVGGLVGFNDGSYTWPLDGSITECYSTCDVTGNMSVGGLLGHNSDGYFQPYVSRCYSTGTIVGVEDVGGLVGWNKGGIGRSYSTGAVIGTEDVGGFVGEDRSGYGIWSNFWDNESSGQLTSSGNNPAMNPEITGLTTIEMQTARTFLEAGWDFVDETANGTDDIWWILEGQDYPRLWWQAEEQ